MHPTLDRRHAATSQELNAKLHSLQQLCHTLSDFSSSYLDLGSDQWIEKEYEWALKEAGEYPATPRNFDADEDIDACSPSVYDPTLFSSPPLSPSKSASRNLTLHQRVSSEKEKKISERLAERISDHCSEMVAQVNAGPAFAALSSRNAAVCGQNGSMMDKPCFAANGSCSA
ncbi:hypothetical protein B0H21DRAFT_710779 [Amylocystis lapponica]|nr:hypothetical protein B0H21DRAFT_710779 [Amylocystis lapponica]